MQKLLNYKSLLLLTALLALFAMPVLADCPIDEEYAEALKQTEDDFKAFNKSLGEGSDKLTEVLGKYQEWEDAVFSQNPEKGIALAKKIFNLTDAQRAEAQQKVNQIRDMFNTLDKNGLKTKLKSTAARLKQAKGYADEALNVWEFAKKFDPANAKENPTYGLRLIGSLLTEGAEKFEKLPLLGQILGPWVKAYGEVATDFANALDKLSAKIKDFRQGSLCGQLGMWVDQQSAFAKASRETAGYGGEDCLTYFSIVKFPRIKAMVFEGSNYFIFDPATCEGHFCPIGMTDQVYEWHGMLLKTRRLEPGFLADRARSLKNETINQAREWARLLKQWNSRSHSGWLIMECRDLLEKVDGLGLHEEEVIVANILLDEEVNRDVKAIMDTYEKYIYAEGTVYTDEDGQRQPAASAYIDVTVGGQTQSTATDGSGQFKICMKGEPGSTTETTVTKEGYDDVKRSGRWPDRVFLGWNFTLTKEALTFTISGTVYDTTGGKNVPVSGATVTASSTGNSELGSTATGGDGGFTLAGSAPENATVNVSATKGSSTGAYSFVCTGQNVSGVSIMLGAIADEDEPGTGWTVVASVTDANGGPLPGATVSGGPSAVTTDASGIATIGPMSTANDASGNPASVTLTPTVKAQDGETVGGGAVTVTYDGQPTYSVALSIPVEIAVQVTITGRVVDDNGIGIEGAAVTCGSASTATGGGGRFSIGPLDAFPNQAFSVTASLSDGGNTFGAGPVTVTYLGDQKTLSVGDMTMALTQFQQVTVSGRVVGADGKTISGAAVTGGGVSTTSGGGGTFTLPAFEHELGTPVSLTATVTVHDGSAVSGQTSITPTTTTAGGATITVDVEEVPEDELDSLINDLEDDVDSTGSMETQLAEFRSAISRLDGIAADFYSSADYFSQRIRELTLAATSDPNIPCDNASAAYALTQAERNLDDYTFALASLPNVYANVVTASTDDPFSTGMASVDAEFSRAYEQKSSLQGRYGSMLAEYAALGCDKENADVIAGEIASEDDLDDIGRGVEVCGDGIDNDGDLEIDECDAGCCDKNVQVTVSDCGNAADDIFQVAIDGSTVGVTPKGASNTFNVQLDVGGHSVTITCLDDGGDPKGTDVGTACITITVNGTDVIGGDGVSIAYGGTSTTGFTVPTDGAAPVQKTWKTFIPGE